MLKPITRRRFLKEGGTAALSVALCGTLRISAASVFDLVLKGGTLLDGTGGRPGRVLRKA